MKSREAYEQLKTKDQILAISQAMNDISVNIRLSTDKDLMKLKDDIKKHAEYLEKNAEAITQTIQNPTSSNRTIYQQNVMLLLANSIMNISKWNDDHPRNKIPNETSLIDTFKDTFKADYNDLYSELDQSVQTNAPFNNLLKDIKEKKIDMSAVVGTSSEKDSSPTISDDAGSESESEKEKEKDAVAKVAPVQPQSQPQPSTSTPPSRSAPARPSKPLPLPSSSASSQAAPSPAPATDYFQSQEFRDAFQKTPAYRQITTFMTENPNKGRTADWKRFFAEINNPQHPKNAVWHENLLQSIAILDKPECSNAAKVKSYMNNKANIDPSTREAYGNHESKSYQPIRALVYTRAINQDLYNLLKLLRADLNELKQKHDLEQNGNKQVNIEDRRVAAVKQTQVGGTIPVRPSTAAPTLFTHPKTGPSLASAPDVKPQGPSGPGGSKSEKSS